MATENQIDELQAAIGRTNNGYIFAPLEFEIRVAREHPELFTITNVGGEFPIRISDKKPAKN